MTNVLLGRRAFLSGRFGVHLVGRIEAPPIASPVDDASAATNAPVVLGLAPRLPDERAAFRRRALAKLAPRTMRARIDRFACLGSTGQSCTSCLEHCPIPGAIRMDGTVPRVDADRCDGCGLCEPSCPAPLGAVRVLPVLGATTPGGAG